MNLLCHLGIHQRWRWHRVADVDTCSQRLIDMESGPTMARCWRCDKPAWRVA